mmetsp:Transcript_51224/g.81613  ORF Transcript_51224/g.81613 Transcript_51224/m.81613 type:complete len:366 (-) Transcript_51224:38-1135(-)
MQQQLTKSFAVISLQVLHIDGHRFFVTHKFAKTANHKRWEIALVLLSHRNLHRSRSRIGIHILLRIHIHIHIAAQLPVVVVYSGVSVHVLQLHLDELLDDFIADLGHSLLLLLVQMVAIDQAIEEEQRLCEQLAIFRRIHNEYRLELQLVLSANEEPLVFVAKRTQIRTIEELQVPLILHLLQRQNDAFVRGEDAGHFDLRGGARRTVEVGDKRSKVDLGHAVVKQLGVALVQFGAVHLHHFAQILAPMMEIRVSFFQRFVRFRFRQFAECSAELVAQFGVIRIKQHRHHMVLLHRQILAEAIILFPAIVALHFFQFIRALQHIGGFGECFLVISDGETGFEHFPFQVHVFRRHEPITVSVAGIV